MVPKWAPKWRELGTQLNIDQHLMDIIERDCHNDCESCCRKMFSKWLYNNPSVSWEDITTAVDTLLSDGMLRNLGCKLPTNNATIYVHYM